MAETLMSRDHILHKVRTALGRQEGQAPASPPPVRLRAPEATVEARIESLCRCVEALAGKTYRAASRDAARDYVSGVIGAAGAVASNAPFLAECGITALAGVRSGLTDRLELRGLCARMPFGITSADYALADTGTLVMLASRQEARLISLLPPVHLAVVPRERILTSLDELPMLQPLPVEERSSMVLITGPSRTADIEQILVRGVHGPGEVHVILV
ncbi:MAG: lactate utilization protein [Candidatus Solibacter usitatus]|nr:lactate utilization protein [Candidatus Solibacter usitatus]